jgi:hypothetical protein
LTIRWRRLVDEKGRTCPRCQSTGDTVSNTFRKIEKALAELGIAVDLKTEAIDLPMFTSDPLQSNRIWIGGRLLEEWIGGTEGQSRCCEVCGEFDCRTISVDNDTYEAIPEEMIVKASLLAAATLFDGKGAD